MKSMEEPPKDYEQMLQKYEGEVRNHIKIEQQLKLHIECVQDKLDDSEKARERLDKDKLHAAEELRKDVLRYKDLLSLREKEIDSLRADNRRYMKMNEDLVMQARELPVRSATVMKVHDKSDSILEDMIYNSANNFDTSELRQKKQNMYKTGSAISAFNEHNQSQCCSEKSNELIRLKAEYH